MTTFYLGQSEKTIRQLRREANVRVTPMGQIVTNEVAVTVKKYRFYQDTSPRFTKRSCSREGWDSDESKNEACGSRFSEAGCKCHPDFCPDCSAEVHGYSLTRPGVIEKSSLISHCSSRGNHS